MSIVRRLDHVAIAVPSTEEAIATFATPLGLEVASQEVVEELGVRLTYLDAGNAMIQLVEPIGPAPTPLSEWVAATGGGLHHLCFGTDDVAGSANALSVDGTPASMGRGRGRPSSFAPGLRAGVRVEFTRFDRTADVDHVDGYLKTSDAGVAEHVDRG